MRVKIYGTRGSAPVCRPGTSRSGGNTTCLRVLSPCLPPDTALLIDAGTGLGEAARDLVREGIRRVLLLLTHYHHDHTQGFPTALITHEPGVEVFVFGPMVEGKGPAEIFEDLLRPPHFPVPFDRVRGHIQAHSFEDAGAEVLWVHPQAGHEVQQRSATPGDGVPVEVLGVTVPPGECLRIAMAQTTHPEYTISYRLEEVPTGRVMVLLTDHEASEEFPEGLRRHLEGVHLLLQDAQYLQSHWQERYSGWGHGTGVFASRVLRETRPARMGLTHHAPEADDADVEAILEEARESLRQSGQGDLVDRLFAARDYQELEV